MTKVTNPYILEGSDRCSILSGICPGAQWILCAKSSYEEELACGFGGKGSREQCHIYQLSCTTEVSASDRNTLIPMTAVGMLARTSCSEWGGHISASKGNQFSKIAAKLTNRFFCCFSTLSATSLLEERRPSLIDSSISIVTFVAFVAFVLPSSRLTVALTLYDGCSSCYS